jgi:dipeptidyl aminopeptidase/acylaminoacyl peptidase
VQPASLFTRFRKLRSGSNGASRATGLVLQGTKDQWTSVELAEQLAADYRRGGGSLDLLLVEGERHTFVNEHPFAPNSVRTVEAVQAFIKKHGAGRQQAAR